MKPSWLVFCDIRTDGSSSTKETVEGYDSRTESIVRIFYDPLLSSQALENSWKRDCETEHCSFNLDSKSKKKNNKEEIRKSSNESCVILRIKEE